MRVSPALFAWLFLALAAPSVHAQMRDGPPPPPPGSQDRAVSEDADDEAETGETEDGETEDESADEGAGDDGAGDAGAGDAASEGGSGEVAQDGEDAQDGEAAQDGEDAQDGEAAQNARRDPPEPPPAYEPQLLRLSEILGAMHYLHGLCGAGDVEWRGDMQDLLEAENPSFDRRNRLVARFNRGYGDYSQTYRRCTDSARLVLARYRSEGARLAQEIATRYGT